MIVAWFAVGSDNKPHIVNSHPAHAVTDSIGVVAAADRSNRALPVIVGLAMPPARTLQPPPIACRGKCDDKAQTRTLPTPPAHETAFLRGFSPGLSSIAVGGAARDCVDVQRAPTMDGPSGR